MRALRRLDAEAGLTSALAMLQAVNARELIRTRQVEPSILSADYSRLGEQVETVMEAGARVIHVDVMDGHFVPPITIGPLIVEGIRDQVHEADGFIDVHLMIERPEHQVQAFADAGADGITVHVEATPHVHYAVKAVREAGLRAGVALNPATPPEAVSQLAGVVDLVLCMTVNPGWGGQAYSEGSERKVKQLRNLMPQAAVEVDGGIDAATAGPCAAAGASVLVAGSAVFGSSDAAGAVRAIAAATAT
jgi:ribulose-phosphate 3-epimerase